MVEVREQCKGCFHFQVCAEVMKKQLFIREKLCREENPQCEHYSPSADVVEVKRGKWSFDHPNGSYYCSCCGKGIKIKYGERAAVGWDFCPNCGAQMKGGAE